MTKRALLVGINYTHTRYALRGCWNDVYTVAGVIRRVGYVDVVRMLDSPSVSPSLQPNKRNILAQLGKIVASTRRGDTLFFHYSGHGTQTRDLNGDEKDGLDECICPVDGTLITDDELRAVLQRLPAGSTAHVVLDCCHSGSGCDLKYTYSAAGGGNVRLSGTNTKYADTQADIYMLSGCMDHQTSADAYEANKFQGALTWAFALNYPSKPNSSIKFGELLAKILVTLRRHRYAQVTQFMTGKPVVATAVLKL